jgi:CDP-diacylglycerol--glycerol-3-phosphate 3-phosphatidyltransferase
MGANNLSPFVRDLLDDLRSDGFMPAAGRRFLARAWEQSRTTAAMHPALTRSWARSVVAVTAAQGSALIVEALVSDPIAAWRAAPGALLWMGWASFDCWAHLGMAQSACGRPLNPTLGPANTLTLARRAMAGLLIGRLLSKRPVSRRYALLVTIAAASTDAMDGVVARRRNEASRLGAYLDGIADLEIWTALTLTLAAQRLWPAWLTRLALLRWLAPFAGAAGSYFARSRGVAFRSTQVGKLAGVAHVASLGLALTPTRGMRRITGIRTSVYGLTAALMVVAPVAQVLRVTVARTNQNR